MAKVDIYGHAAETRTGVWCNGCMTSAGIEIDLVFERAGGTPLGVQTLTYCLNCPDDEERDDVRS